MPELPELEVIRDVLERRIVGATIEEVMVLPPGGPIVVRDLTGRGFAEVLVGTNVAAILRRGKFLTFAFEGRPTSLAVNPKLSGRFQLASPATKRKPKTHVV